MENHNIDISKSAITLTVSGTGETVVMNMGDQNFIHKLISLNDSFTNALSEYEKKIEEIGAQPEETTQQKFSKAKTLASYNLEVCSGIRSMVDDTLGAGSCDKIFGKGVIPSVDMFSELFFQLIPAFEEYNNQKTAQVRKYTDKYMKKE